MSDIASELEAVSPDDGGRRNLLTEILPSAISQVFFLAGFADHGDPGTGGNDPILPPLPHAS